MQAHLTHIALHVPELEPCIGFYREYCGFTVVHERSDDGKRVVWLAEPGQEGEFVIVVMDGGPPREHPAGDYEHFGFAMDSEEAVDAVAERARNDGCLLWEPRRERFPVGYYCGLIDPAGNQVEFSYGQPLGPGALELGVLL